MPRWDGEIDKTTLKRYVRDGLTQRQMVERFKEETGISRSRTAFAMALTRFGLKSPHQRPRYAELLPWKVRTEHLMDYNARMLRLLGRRRAGGKLTAEEGRYLDAWLADLDQLHAVVHYDSATDQGFWLVPRENRDTDVIRQPVD